MIITCINVDRAHSSTKVESPLAAWQVLNAPGAGDFLPFLRPSERPPKDLIFLLENLISQLAFHFFFSLFQFLLNMRIDHCHQTGECS